MKRGIHDLIIRLITKHQKNNNKQSFFINFIECDFFHTIFPNISHRFCRYYELFLHYLYHYIKIDIANTKRLPDLKISSSSLLQKLV